MSEAYFLINDQSYVWQPSTLSDIFARLNLEPQGYAIAMNQQIIPRQQWAETEIPKQADIQLFRAIAGG